MNKYLEELEKLNQELSQMTDEEILALLPDTLDEKDALQFAQLERMIVGNGYLNLDQEVFFEINSPLALAS